jgi:peptidoglycan hydrolase-like protein with peptidoglycan-binding domain
METFGYLQTVEEYESFESRDLVCVQNRLNLLPSDFKVSGQMMAILAGTACSTAVVGLAGAAQAFPLFPGDSGPDVTYVQNLLTSAGYPVPATGFYGPLTESAVVSFQADSGLVADAVVGSSTLDALEGGFIGVGGSVLRFGDSGSEVTRLQNLLTDAGYPVPATGYFGSQTESAVISFQSASGLVADGLAGPATFDALTGFVPVQPGVPSGSTLRFGDSGPAVSNLQSLLNRAGYFVPVTGYFGSQTESAVISFQSASGLVADGLAGPATFNALEGGFVPVNPEPTRTLRFGDSGDAVAGLQRILIARGFLAPGLDTGYFGSATEAALIAYQRSVGLVADGIYGPATANSLV